jgi:hypothetical protein
VYVLITLVLPAIVIMWGIGYEKAGLTLPVSILLVLLLLAVEARRDLYAFCQYVVAIAGIGTFAVGAALILDLGRGPGSFGLLVACCVSAGSAAYYLFATHSRRDDVPNVLLESFPKEAIVERDGVQWAASAALSEFSKTGFGQLRLVLQNCFDAPRQVSLELYLDNKPIAGSVRLRAGLLAPFELRGAEVVSVLVPVAALGKEAELELRLEPTISGFGGTRIRSFRARGAARRRSLGERAALLGVGVLVWGGGLRVRLTVPARHGRPIGTVLQAEKETLFVLATAPA